MKELIEKVDNFKLELDKTKEVKKIKELNNELSNHKELIDKINKYNDTLDENIKKEIIEDEFFKEYKLSENEINYLILEINSKLKAISKKGICNHENN